MNNEATPGRRIEKRILKIETAKEPLAEAFEDKLMALKKKFRN